MVDPATAPGSPVRELERALVRYGPDGLVAAVVQDAADGRVLMVAWQDAEALEATLRTGEAHFHSRSRGRLWRKGESERQHADRRRPGAGLRRRRRAHPGPARRSHLPQPGSLLLRPRAAPHRRVARRGPAGSRCGAGFRRGACSRRGAARFRLAGAALGHHRPARAQSAAGLVHGPAARRWRRRCRPQGQRGGHGGPHGRQGRRRGRALRRATAAGRAGRRDGRPASTTPWSSAPSAACHPARSSTPCGSGTLPDGGCRSGRELSPRGGDPRRGACDPAPATSSDRRRATELRRRGRSCAGRR